MNANCKLYVYTESKTGLLKVARVRSNFQFQLAQKCSDLENQACASWANATTCAWLLELASSIIAAAVTMFISHKTNVKLETSNVPHLSTPSN